jgi:hypothetical protein
MGLITELYTHPRGKQSSSVLVDSVAITLINVKRWDDFIISWKGEEIKVSSDPWDLTDQIQIKAVKPTSTQQERSTYSAKIEITAPTYILIETNTEAK